MKGRLFFLTSGEMDGIVFLCSLSLRRFLWIIGSRPEKVLCLPFSSFFSGGGGVFFWGGGMSYLSPLISSPKTKMVPPLSPPLCIPEVFLQHELDLLSFSCFHVPFFPLRDGGRRRFSFSFMDGNCPLSFFLPVLKTFLSRPGISHAWPVPSLSFFFSSCDARIAQKCWRFGNLRISRPLPSPPFPFSQPRRRRQSVTSPSKPGSTAPPPTS